MFFRRTKVSWHSRVPTNEPLHHPMPLLKSAAVLTCSVVISSVQNTLSSYTSRCRALKAGLCQEPHTHFHNESKDIPTILDRFTGLLRWYPPRCNIPAPEQSLQVTRQLPLHRLQCCFLSHGVTWICRGLKAVRPALHGNGRTLFSKYTNTCIDMGRDHALRRT
jgi:hypothetical protein